VDTFAQRHYVLSATKAGIAATDAEVAKCQKYNYFADKYCFQPVAIKTTVCSAW